MDCLFLSNKECSCEKNGYRRLPGGPTGVKLLTFKELSYATRNFCPCCKIGEGEFGKIYRGQIETTSEKQGNIHIAVKELRVTWLEAKDDMEWTRKINLLGSIRHPNLVRLLGHGTKRDKAGTQRFLIYKYMINRSVQDALLDQSTPLPWATRLKIACDAARGLAHLHEKIQPPLIYRCFKSSKVLLDEQWNAKLTDWGLARLGPMSKKTHKPIVYDEVEMQWAVSVYKDFCGYSAPEFIQIGLLTARGNVWSYGVFLYELITGKPAFDLRRPRNMERLVDCLGLDRLKMSISQFSLILDDKLHGMNCLESAYKLSQVANLCLSRKPERRPRMSTVLKMVNEIVEEM